MSLIRKVDTRLFRVPLAEVLTDAKHGDHSHLEIVTTTIELDDGASGTGYTYTGGRGGGPICAALPRAVPPFCDHRLCQPRHRLRRARRRGLGLSCGSFRDSSRRFYAPTLRRARVHPW